MKITFLKMKMKSMKAGVRMFTALFAAIVMLVMVRPADATQPVDVTITATVDFTDAVPDPFVATGDVICNEGSELAVYTRFVGEESGSHGQIITRKHFVCDDDSGTFDLLLRVTLPFDTGDTDGTWSVVGSSGTGEYTHLHGGGHITGDTIVPDVSILDQYTGRMSIK